MSLLRAFERNVERGGPSVKIIPRYKLVAEQAAIELQKEIKTAQVRVNPEEIRRMVAESQATLLMQEVARLRAVISDTQAQCLNLLTKFEQYKEVTEKLAEETGKMAEVRSLSKRYGQRGIYVRDAKAVAKRWDAWRKLYEQGMSDGEIAARYGVAQETVLYARKKNWISSRKASTTVGNQNKPTTKENQ